MRKLLALLGVASTVFAAGCAAGDINDEGGVEDDTLFSAESIQPMRQVLIHAKNAGLACADLAMAGAIAKAESGLETSAKGANGPTSGCSGGSVDRGLWQINSCYHPTVTESCAFDSACNARAMAKISSNGKNWGPWSTYHNGAYKKHLAASRAAYASGVPGCTSGSGGSSGSTESCRSETLGRDVGAGSCVESKFDGDWYTCVGGEWTAGKSSCTSSYPLAGSSGQSCVSNTLGRTVSEGTCVESKFDSTWYTCVDGAWRYGQGAGLACVASFPL